MANNDEENQESEAEKAARKAECQALAEHETPVEGRRRRLTGVTYLLAGIIAILLLWSLSVVCKTLPGGPANSEQQAIAQATSCEQVGPISRYGLGYWSICQADVRWPGGEPTQGVTFYKSELTQEDVGKQVAVTQESTDNRGGDHWVRDTTRPLDFAAIVLYIAIVAVGLYSLVNGLARVISLGTRLELDNGVRKRYREFYEREGRILPTSSQASPPQASEQYPPPPPPPYQPGPGQ